MIEIDAQSGFCNGVIKAIDKAEAYLQTGQTLFCLGDIVHNGQEVARLAAKGLETIDYDDLRTLHNVTVLIRAHGEPPSTYRIAEQNNNKIIDASCPVVLALQRRIKKIFDTSADSQIVIFGKKGHAEVIGLQGQTKNTAIVIENEDDIDSIDFNRPIYFFSQTTKSENDFLRLSSLIEQKAQNGFCAYNTICRQVANRVEHLQDFARKHNIVIFVGGQKSSNAKVLYQHCKAANERTYFMSSPTEISQEFIELCTNQSVGICGATSTPRWLMQQFADKLSE